MAKIGILTGGGDCAGLNAVIASIVKSGAVRGHSFIGFRKGLEGLLNPVRWQPLELEDVRGISHLGGTVLGTTSHGRFPGKTGKGTVNSVQRDILLEAKKNIDSLGLDGLIVIGGDGTLSAASQLKEVGVNIVGVPKTIDNDLSSTDLTFGFSSAVRVAVEALDKIHTTATSHDRVFFVECMGRHTGWIALNAGLAGNASAVILPEFDLDLPDFIDFLRKRIEVRGMAIIVVAEGSKFARPQEKTARESGSEVLIRGASEALMSEVEYLAPNEFEMRNVVLGHIQRGGTPDTQDRILAKHFGVAAMEAFEAGKFDHMVRLHNNEITPIPIDDAIGELKRVTADNHEYQLARKLGIYIH